MGVVLTIAAVLLLAGTFAATLLFFPALWRGVLDQWRRHPAERRRLGLVGGGITGILLAVEVVLVIAAPWGGHTVLYVLGIGNGVLTVLVMAAVGVQAVQETRQARLRRSRRL